MQLVWAENVWRFQSLDRDDAHSDHLVDRFEIPPEWRLNPLIGITLIRTWTDATWNPTVGWFQSLDRDDAHSDLSVNGVGLSDRLGFNPLIGMTLIRT